MNQPPSSPDEQNRGCLLKIDHILLIFTSASHSNPDTVQRQRSASSVSGKSLNMLGQSVSEAMEYLQRQFEDEDQTTEENVVGEEDSNSTAAVSKREKKNLSLDNVLGYSSNVMSQVYGIDILFFFRVCVFLSFKFCFNFM